MISPKAVAENGDRLDCIRSAPDHSRLTAFAQGRMC